LTCIALRIGIDISTAEATADQYHDFTGATFSTNTMGSEQGARRLVGRGERKI
jgi:hypothetical protein